MNRHRIRVFLITALAVLCLVSCASTSSSSAKAEPLDDEIRNYYEIYVGSYFDTDNDGIGDLNGVTEKLPYIKDMGFNGIWLMPITVGSSYHKYDVENYYDVDPQFGTLDDMRNLVRTAHSMGIDIIIDLVVNHSSSSHPWFKSACEYLVTHGEPGGDYGEYYNFSQTQKQGYQRVSGSAWYYECQFVGTMPDLNLDSTKVRDEIENIMKFWLEDIGIDGFRLDAVTSFYTNSTQKSIDFLAWLNRTAKAIKSDCYIVGEAWLGNNKAVREYYASGIDSFFCFPLATGTGRVADTLKDIRSNPGEILGNLMLELEEVYDTGILAPFLSNHDTARVASFTGRSQTDKIKMSQGLLSLMSGSPFVYYGEEIGMISTSDGSDPYKRIAMKWSDKSVYEGWCYTSPQPEAWHYSRDKVDYKKLATAVGAPLADDYFLSDPPTREELDQIKYPVVVKPVDLSCNRGISYVHDEKELLEACDYARSMSKSRKLVIERMLHGEEWYGTYALADGKVSLLGLCAMYAEPGYPKFCYSITSTLSNHVEDFCREINPHIERVLQEVGCREGYAWTQAMLDEDGHFYIIEMGYRLDGDMMYVPIKDLLGFDTVAWIVDYALGDKNDPKLLPPSQEKAFKRVATSYMLWTNELGGTIGAIEGLDEVKSWPGVTVDSLAAPGDPIRPYGPLGCILFTCEDCEATLRMIKKVNDTVRITNTDGKNVLIYYTDFDYLRGVYREGLEGK